MVMLFRRAHGLASEVDGWVRGVDGRQKIAEDRARDRPDAVRCAAGVCGGEGGLGETARSLCGEAVCVCPF